MKGTIMFNEEQVVMLISEWVRANPLQALKALASMKPVRDYIIKTLDDEDINWLSAQILSNPTGLLTYVNSRPGKRAFRDMLFEYKQSVTPPSNSNEVSK